MHISPTVFWLSLTYPNGVHQEKKRQVELFVSPVNGKPGEPQALQAEEVLRSLNVDALQQNLRQFGITDISPEVWHCTEKFIKKKNLQLAGFANPTREALRRKP